MKRYYFPYRLLCVLVTLCCLTRTSLAQSVLTAWKDKHEEADQSYRTGNYTKAATLYEAIFAKQSSKETILRLARSYYFTGRYHQAMQWYEKFESAYGEVPENDLYFLAEVYAALGKYDPAVKMYSKVLSKQKDNLLVAKKIWRLRNLQFLYEDSLHYSVEALNLNSPDNELAAVVTDDGVLFVSDRPQPSVVAIKDANTQRAFYKLYFASAKKDSLGVTTSYEPPHLLDREFKGRYNEGSVALYDHGTKMIYTASSETPGVGGRRTLQLFFAEKREGRWYRVDPFPYNSPEHSLSDPAIQEDGRVLYFVSDMKGGQGGKDLYRCEMKDGKWTRPFNLVDLNTPFEESSPFLHHHRTLYFSSTGHAGMGGRDIFKADITANGFGEVTNLGYPINTHFDDFAFSLDSVGVTGYFTSNRKNDGADDDVYRVDIDMQPYPLTIEGVISFKEIHSPVVTVLPHARLTLIDNFKNVPVSESFSDSSGNFVLRIPYFSQYKIKVTDEHNNENVVSLEVPRHRKKEEKHEIVVIRDAFRNKP